MAGPVLAGADQLTRTEVNVLADTDGAAGFPGGSLASLTVTRTERVADFFGSPLSVALTRTT